MPLSPQALSLSAKYDFLSQLANQESTIEEYHLRPSINGVYRIGVGVDTKHTAEHCGTANVPPAVATVREAKEHQIADTAFSPQRHFTWAIATKAHKSIPD